MKMTNRWNQFIYRIWAPVYDTFMGRFFSPGRKRAMESLDLKPGERVLLVGVGTGADLELLPGGIKAVGIDLSPEMLARCRSRLPLPGREVTLIQGDAQKMLAEESAFDAIIFNLILSVIPDPVACLRENLRSLKPAGRAVVFDKFLPYGGHITSGHRFLNGFSTLFGTDITRRFEEINAASECKVVQDKLSLLNGMYRVIMLKKVDSKSKT
jgi:phosphatidylethanolamine/phosphatidyl-N-methylethanolamine N-methyltransferase